MSNLADHVWTELGVLRGNTKHLPGVLHEAQVKLLIAWGHLALQHVVGDGQLDSPHEDFEVFWNPDKREISYIAEKTVSSPHELFQDIMEGLDRSIKALLGEDVAVFVKVAGEAVFLGARKEVNERRG